VGVAVACLVMAVASSARADGPELEIPWWCGEVRACTQGHNGGSHTGNTSWAWDFGIAEGDEVRAVSSGTVTHIKMDGDQGGCSSTYNPYANYVVVDHGDGTSLLYLHLQQNSSPLRVGDTVTPGQLVARVGLTGWVCGAHLHMQVQETCGGAYCQSVPATFADFGDPGAGEQIESTNCPACEAVLTRDAPVTISERDAGCVTHSTNYWWSSFSGDEGHHFYTIATDLSEPVATATWRFAVGDPGPYLLEVFVADTDANAELAGYQVHHAAGMDVVMVDQAAQKGWQALGVFELAGGRDERVQLDDNTGEAEALDRRLAADAVRFTFMDDPDEGGTTTSETDPTDPGSGGGSTTASTSGGSASGAGGGSGGMSGDSTGDGSSLPGAGTPGRGGDESCACSTDDEHRSPPAWLALLLIAGFRRRAQQRR
jgi:MYXO-CTERM domain-containing protein